MSDGRRDAPAGQARVVVADREMLRPEREDVSNPRIHRHRREPLRLSGKDGMHILELTGAARKVANFQ